jgi:hypothetical protein
MIHRYMIVSYFLKPTGKWDEVTDFKNKLSTTHLTTAKVILDLKEKKLIKNSINEKASYDEMIEFYKRTIGDELIPYLPKD